MPDSYEDLGNFWEKGLIEAQSLALGMDIEAPAVEAPAIDAPMVDAPLIDAPVVDAPAIDAPIIADAPISMPEMPEIEI